MHTSGALRKSPRTWSGWTRAVASLVTLCVAVGGGPFGLRVWAAPAKKRVLVVGTQRGEDVPATVVTRVVGFVDTMLGIDEKLEVVEAEGLAPPEVKVAKTTKVAEKGTLDRADEAALAAQKLAEKKRWADALKAWTKAIALYEKGLAQMKDVAPYARALAGRALAYFGQGYDDNGEEELALALAVKPDLEADTTAPPNAVAVFEKVRGRVKPAGVLLTVRSSTPGAVVLVDGKRVGKPPVVLGELARGGHVVRVVAADYEAFGQLVAIGTDAIELDAELVSKPGELGVVMETAGPKALETGIEGYAASGDFGAAFQGVAKGLAKANRLDVVLWTYVRKAGEDYELGAFVWDAPMGRVGAVGTVTVSGDLGGLQVTVLELMEKASAVINGASPFVAVTGKPPIYGQAKAVTADGGRSGRETPERIGGGSGAGMVAESDKSKGKNGETAPESDKSTNKSGETAPESDKSEVAASDARNKTPDTVLREPKRPNGGRSEGYEVAPMKRPPPYPGPEVDEDGGPAFYETWWFWTLMTGIAAGGATAVILGTGGSDGPGGFRTTVTW